MTLDIAVTVKIVPKPDEVKFNPTTRTLDRAQAENILNPTDKHALEAALALRDAQGGTVSVVSMGPPFAAGLLDLCIGMGADRAVLASDRLFAGSDTYPTSLVLARLVQYLPRYDLVVCGEESADAATGQVPGGIAEWLGIPQVTLADGFRMKDGELIARRALGDAFEVVWTSLPALVSMVAGANSPRFPSFRRVDESARMKKVEVVNAAALRLSDKEVGLPGSFTIVDRVVEGAPRERRREFVRGSTGEQVVKLASVLRPYVQQ